MKNERTFHMKPRDIIVKAFSEWTAFSATRSACPVKSSQAVYPLIRLPDYKEILTGEEIKPQMFDAWHLDATRLLCEKSDKPLPVGWAAKIINVYLKTRVYIAGEGRFGLTGCIHPPIDGGLWQGIMETYVDRQDIIERTHCVTRMKDIMDYITYMTIIDGCRLIAEERGCLLIEVEELWKGILEEK